jgi:hypothetical protein
MRAQSATIGIGQSEWIVSQLLMMSLITLQPASNQRQSDWSAQNIGKHFKIGKHFSKLRSSKGVKWQAVSAPSVEQVESSGRL